MTPTRVMLLQVRNDDDPMGVHEIACFARRLGCSPSDIQVVDLVHQPPSPNDLAEVELVLIGGSGDYSVSEGGTWLEPALGILQHLQDTGKPTFASCWGFQAMAAAMGGEVIHDSDRAEVGTLRLYLSRAGMEDPVFGPLGETFDAQVGHQDVVTRLPKDGVLLASTQLVENHAFCFSGSPIYCTQFHPELNRSELLDRLQQYPSYVEAITGMPYEDFVEAHCREVHATELLLPRFVAHVFGREDYFS